jgi:hypothetical protein
MVSRLKKRGAMLTAIATIALAGAAQQAQAAFLPLQYFTVGTFDTTSATGVSDSAPATFGVTPSGNGSILTITGGGATTTLTFNASSVSTALFSPISPVPFSGSGLLGSFTLASNVTSGALADGITFSLDVYQTNPFAGGSPSSPTLVGSVHAEVFFGGSPAALGSNTTVTFSPFVTVAPSVPPVTYTITQPLVNVPITGATPVDVTAAISAPNAGVPLPGIANMGLGMFGLLGVGLVARKRRRPLAT